MRFSLRSVLTVAAAMAIVLAIVAGWMRSNYRIGEYSDLNFERIKPGMKLSQVERLIRLRIEDARHHAGSEDRGAYQGHLHPLR